MGKAEVNETEMRDTFLPCFGFRFRFSDFTGAFGVGRRYEGMYFRCGCTIPACRRSCTFTSSSTAAAAAASTPPVQWKERRERDKYLQWAVVLKELQVAGVFLEVGLRCISIEYANVGECGVKTGMEWEWWENGCVL